MSVSIDKQTFNEIIDCLEKAAQGKLDTYLQANGNGGKADILINSVNKLVRHISSSQKNNCINGNDPSAETIPSETYFKNENGAGTSQFARYVMDKANEAIYGLDHKGNIIYANEAALKMLEYTKEEMSGKTIFEIDPAIRKKEWAKHWSESKDKKFSFFESKHKTKTGRIIPVEVAIGFIVFEGNEYHSSFVRDITERKKAEEELLLTQYSLDSASIDIIRTGSQGEIISANAHICKSLNYSREELLNMYIWDIDPSFNIDVWNKLRKFLQKENSLIFETVHRRKNGSEYPVEINATYRVFNGKEFAISFIKDLTEQKEAQSALKQSEFLLKESQRVAKLGHYVLNIRTGDWNGSEVLFDILGIKDSYPSNISGWLNHLQPDYSDNLYLYFFKDVLKNRGKFDREYKIVRPDNNEERWIHVLGEIKSGSKAKASRMIGTVQDITERKKAEEELKSSLKEKEVLLKELYHRTKNNMQVIRAMLAIKASYAADDGVKKNYLDMENRILTMSLVHQKLYQSQSLSSIDLKEYIEDLTGLLMKSYGIPEEVIKISLHLESISVLIDVAIPCGLILNELLANSIKHAFPDERKGKIKISLSTTNGDKLVLLYSDNGVGVPADFNFRAQESLGIQSIYTITEHQLQGNAEFKVNKGIECRIEMNNSLYSPRV